MFVCIKINTRKTQAPLLMCSNDLIKWRDAPRQPVRVTWQRHLKLLSTGSHLLWRNCTSTSSSSSSTSGDIIILTVHFLLVGKRSHMNINILFPFRVGWPSEPRRRRNIIILILIPLERYLYISRPSCLFVCLSLPWLESNLRF